MGLESSANLLLAAMDLNLVRLLRRAMNTGGPGGAGLAGPGRQIEQRTIGQPDPRFDTRPVHHPTPLFMPRQVLHPAPRREPEASVPVDPGAHKPDIGRIGPPPPPWKCPPSDAPAAPPPVIKSALYRTDIQNKGSLLDLFM